MVKKYKCEITGNYLPKDLCYRFVLSPEGKICFDPRFELIGKNVVISSEEKVIIDCLNSKFFEEKFGVEVDLEIVKKQIITHLYNKILTFIALAKKSGRLLEGKKQVDEKLQFLDTNKVLIVQATDSSLREKYKVSTSTNIIEIFSSHELSRLLGNEETKYALVMGDFVLIIQSLYEKYKIFSENR